VTVGILIVIGIVAAIALVTWLTRGPTAEELRIRRTKELQERLGLLTDSQMRIVFARLAGGPTEQQDWLEAALEAPEDIPDSGE